MSIRSVHISQQLNISIYLNIRVSMEHPLQIIFPDGRDLFSTPTGVTLGTGRFPPAEVPSLHVLFCQVSASLGSDLWSVGRNSRGRHWLLVSMIFRESQRYRDSQIHIHCQYIQCIICIICRVNNHSWTLLMLLGCFALRRVRHQRGRKS